MISDVLERCARCDRMPQRLEPLEDRADTWWRVGCGCGSRWILVASTSDRPRTSSPATDERDAAERAREMWHAANDVAGTPVETYLRDARRIPPPYPPTIRFLPCAWHAESKRPHPVMLAAVQGPDARLRAVTRTFLSVDGRAKAPAEPVR